MRGDGYDRRRCSIRRSSRRTTSVGSTRRRSTTRARTRSAGRSSSNSSPGGSRWGATEEGAEVLELGLVGTEMVYFAVGELELDGGIMVTASHNPKEYTGMKIVRRGALPVGGESGLLDVRDKAVAVVDRLGGGEGR